MAVSSLFLAVLALPQQDPGAPAPGVEGFLDSLRAHAAPRRAAAREAWKSFGPLYLEKPGEDTIAPLLAAAPEIQEPALEELAAASAAAASERVAALVALLGASMNAAGAESLAALVPALPVGEQAPAIEAVVARGGAATVAGAERWLLEGAPAQRAAALSALLAHAPIERAPGWLAHPATAQLDGTAVGAALERLAARPLPETLRLPAALYQRREGALVAPLLGVLQRAPDPDTEAFLIRVLEQPGRDRDTRLSALAALERGSQAFHWRDGEKRLEQLLEQKPPDPLSEPFAWTLHRLGNKTGTRFLLAVPQAAVKSNPRSWRNRFALGRTLVELGDWTEAYTHFAEGVDLVEDTPNFSNVRREDWLYAARAAAGARRLRDAAAWLEASEMSPVELEAYRALPEFAPLLDRQPFKRLFGLE
ncbi:MAG: hypothetical protein EYC70_13115 [Planctomycetota bacterium]|nr:MAG: hypothetical protein EYC70_13115 [Planctomycetota bacterium]